LIDANQQAAWLERISKDPSIKMFGVLLTNDEKAVPVGVCGLTSIDRINQSAEFSLYIAPQFQHRGIGRGALHALLSHGFMDQNLNRIWGEVFGENPALKMFKSLGMQVEGVMRSAYFRAGKFTDATRVSILRSEWNV
jgi:diamine N-acetyltransferase